jgi:hypothetical protein
MSTGWAPSGFSGPCHRLLEHAAVGIIAGKTLWSTREPVMAGAVLVQHHAGQCLSRPLAPVGSTPGRLLNVAAVLKVGLGPAAAPAETM